jgi:hypothetical protein
LVISLAFLEIRFLFVLSDYDREFPVVFYCRLFSAFFW